MRCRESRPPYIGTASRSATVRGWTACQASHSAPSTPGRHSPTGTLTHVHTTTHTHARTHARSHQPRGDIHLQLRRSYLTTAHTFTYRFPLIHSSSGLAVKSVQATCCQNSDRMSMYFIIAWSRYHTTVRLSVYTDLWEGVGETLHKLKFGSLP